MAARLGPAVGGDAAATRSYQLSVGSKTKAAVCGGVPSDRRDAARRLDLSERTVQRWKMQLIHGHGGRVGQAVFLEYHRDTAQTNAVRATEQLVYRSAETA